MTFSDFIEFKIQKWYDTFQDVVVKINFPYYIWVDIYSEKLMAIDTNPEIVTEMYLLLLSLVM